MQVRLSKWLTELEQMFYGMSNSFDKVRSCGPDSGDWYQSCQAQALLLSLCFQTVAHGLQALRGEEDFVDALVRNIYGKDETKRPDAQRLYAYIKRWAPRPDCFGCASPLLSHRHDGERQRSQEVAGEPTSGVLQLREDLVHCRELACLKQTPSKQLLDGRVKFSEDIFQQ